MSADYSYLACIEALQAAARDLARPPSGRSYRHWRLQQAISVALPADTTIVRLLGPWEQALRIAGLPPVQL